MIFQFSLSDSIYTEIYGVIRNKERVLNNLHASVAASAP